MVVLAILLLLYESWVNVLNPPMMNGYFCGIFCVYPSLITGSYLIFCDTYYLQPECPNCIPF